MRRPRFFRAVVAIVPSVPARVGLWCDRFRNAAGVHGGSLHACGLYLLILLNGFGLPTVTHAASDYLNLQRRIIEIHQKNQEGVFKVLAAFNPQDAQSKALLFVGTGFCVSKEGHILTNTNVTLGADRVWVEREGVAYAAEQVGHDPLTNIALIRMLEPPPQLKVLRLSEMAKPPEIGSLLVALTCELGLEPGPTMGVVKGWNTNYGERILPTVYLRTDIAADGGEGGGPVFDLNGSLVGMMVVALPEIRSSFTLPAKAVSRVMDDILLSGAVTYAHFGFETKQMSEVEKGTYVIIEELEVEGPAALAGLKVGDKLVKVGDYTIDADTDLRLASFYIRPGEYVPVVVMRDDALVELAMKVGVREFPDSEVPPSQTLLLPDTDKPEPVTPKSALGDDSGKRNPVVPVREAPEVAAES